MRLSAITLPAGKRTSASSHAPDSASARPFGWKRRAALLSLLFVLEVAAISMWLDTGSLGHASGLAWAIGRWGAWTLRFAVLFAALFALLSYQKKRDDLERVCGRLPAIPIAWGFLAGHFCALGAFAWLSIRLFRAAPSGALNLVAAAWLAAGLLAIALGAFAFAPPGVWQEAVRATGRIPWYAFGAALAACWLGRESELLWKPATQTTFVLTRMLLRLFLPVVVSDPARYILGTPNFQVEIARQCSGLEGAGLMLAFGSVWLWLFRGEVRFPRALLLIPAGVAALYLLNTARVAGLVLIGNAGWPGVAVEGFHSQAGWISFIAVAAVFAITAQRSSWLAVRQVDDEPAENATAAYLMPFLAILAASMVSRAVSGKVEWLYPLRFFAAGAALWAYRRRYARLEWRFGWTAIGAGTAVFAIWTGLDWAMGAPSGSELAAGLGAWAAAWRIAWLAFRTLGAITTVPIAEELAFRAFLIRRLMAADFESVDARKTTFVAALVSSAAFGLLHGSRWPAGILAGMIYAGVLRRRGRIGDAVIAHAVTNALLAAWVLIGGHWGAW
jgi:exosortase E/protease (VPEID-CTERM system)